MDPINNRNRASSSAYTATTSSDWSPPPDDVQEALDQLAARKDTDDASTLPYEPATPGNWSPPPTEVAEALDQLAEQAQGEVTAVTATAPITSTGGPRPNIAITPATESAPGSMSAADKTKIDNLSAANVPFSPSTPSNWSPVPTDVGPALDQLAAKPSGGGSGNVFVYRESEPSPSGNIFNSFDGAYAAAQAALPATIVVDGTLGDCSIGNALGFNATVGTVSGSTVTLIGLRNMNAGVVGKSIGITNATNAGTNGLFVITAFLSATSVQITNPAAVAGDRFQWDLVDGASAALSAGLPNLVLLVGLVLPNGTNNPPGGITPSMIGQTITLANSGFPTNSGTFTIVAYVSPTVCWIQNALGSAPDSAQWVLGSGSAASVSATDPVHGTATITGLTGIPVGATGWSLNMTGAGSGNNDGIFVVVRVLSPTSVLIQNFGAVAPDPNNGSISWILFPATVSITQALAPTVHVTGLSGISSSAVGNALSIANASSGGNNWVAAIIGWINATSVLLNPVNTSFSPPDANNGNLWWYLGTNYDLSEITLSGLGKPSGNSSFGLFDGATINQGILAVRNNLSVLGQGNFQPYLGTLGFVPYNRTLIVSDASQIDTNTQDVFDLSQTTSTILDLVLETQAQVDDFVWVDDNSNTGLNVTMYEGSQIGNRAINGTAGAITITVKDAAVNPPPTRFSGFSGTPGAGVFTSYQAKAATLVPLTQSGPPTPNNAGNWPLGPYNIQQGSTYFDSNQFQPFWWTGTAWVSWPNGSFNTTNVMQGHATPQSINLGPGDHVMFNVEDVSTGGGNISLDTSSPYQTAPGPSIGRISLAVGHLYKLSFDPSEVAGSGQIFFQWFYFNSNVPSGQPVGTATRLDDGTSGNFASHGQCVAYIYTNTGSGGAAVAELRIQFNSGMTDIGLVESPVPLFASFTVEQVY